MGSVMNGNYPAPVSRSGRRLHSATSPAAIWRDRSKAPPGRDKHDQRGRRFRANTYS